MATHEAGLELQEVPLRSCCRQDVDRADAHAIEHQRELVHERDVEVALRVLDDLRGLRDLDRRRAMNARIDDCAVRIRNALQGLRVLTGDDLRDALERVFFVAGVDALGRVAKLEINAALQS